MTRRKNIRNRLTRFVSALPLSRRCLLVVVVIVGGLQFRLKPGLLLGSFTLAFGLGSPGCRLVASISFSRLFLTSVFCFLVSSNVFKTLKDTKKQKMLVKSSLLTTRKTGKQDNNSRGYRGKKPAARRTKPKGKGKGAQMKARIKPKPKAASDDNKDKDAPSPKGKSTDEPFQSISNILTPCHPSIHGSCKCGTSMEDTFLSIPWSLD